MKVAAIFQFLVLSSVLFGGPEPKDPPPLEPALQAKLAAWLDAEGQSPKDYVVGLFSERDVVFLGETHRVRHDLLLVQDLIRPLYEAGVRVLATEFGRREDQPLIDSLLAAADWDEELAREIVFRQFVFWGYQEYVDIYRSAWALNRKLPEGSPQFRILGINSSYDWSLIKTEADQNDPEVRRKVGLGGANQWADVILAAVRSGEKVLVHCGIHHAFTEYRQPKVSEGKFRGLGDVRCGNYVFKALGKRAVTVSLHGPWEGREGYGAPMRHPADGVIDALMHALGPRPVGFDLKEGPFGELRVEDAVYIHGYEEFKLSDFCDGWIYIKPISQYEGVTPIANWINESNLAHTRAQSPNPRLRQYTIEEFNRGVVAAAEIHRRWGHLR